MNIKRLAAAVSAAALASCAAQEPSGIGTDVPFTFETLIADVAAHDAFGSWGALLFPQDRRFFSGSTLGTLRFAWYSAIDAKKTAEICNYFKERAEDGTQVFFSIYTEAEMQADDSKRGTGLFFFRGNPGAPFALCCAGGGFMYVGAMHDSFPHALEISKRGCNAFALIYRPKNAYEDAARALLFIQEQADALAVQRTGYSLWGGSAGARMAAAFGNRGVLARAGLAGIPQAAAVIMQYTGCSAASFDDAPAYACVGTKDCIAPWRTMRRRLDALERLGIKTEFHVYEGLSHGFGLGTGTAAEGWIDGAVRFWEEMRQ